MKRIFGRKGTQYDAEYTLPGQFAIRSTVVTIKGDAIEAAVIKAVAEEIKVKPTDISIHQIVRFGE